jgi:hypothetical protein
MKDSTKIDSNEYQYKSTMTRRDSLKWLGVLTAGAALPALAGCTEVSEPVASLIKGKGHWPDLKLTPITAKGYGKDPDLIISSTPWPKTLTPEQLTLVAVLSDILVPREGAVPSASEVKVPDVVDEWVSAPYEKQIADRLAILSTLAWIDDEATLRFSKHFVKLSNSQKIEIIDDIAYTNRKLPDEFKQISEAFGRLRKLVLAAFFCSPEGTKDLGYLGNVAIAGDYPGPTDEAMAHLNVKLAELGLSA